MKFMLVIYNDPALFDALPRAQTKVTDGPFSEAKEVLGGFNLIEARDMVHTIKVTSRCPRLWQSSSRGDLATDESM